MKTAALILCAAVAASASPQFGRFGSQATGSANANVISGSSSGPFGGSQITQVSAAARGSTRGNAISRNSASASNFGSSGFFGNSQFSNTRANSVQQSFGGGIARPFRRGRPFRRVNRNRFF